MTRHGFSLLELIVAIAIVGLIVSIVAVTPFRRQNSFNPEQSAMEAALSSGHAIVAVDSSDGRVTSIAAYPSGVVVIDTISATESMMRKDQSDR